eukprot:TRINITY_DN1470_c0_g1_i1.p1 TRINITY_DN1470_c0_g1~~TRINITY_DN1470_c0_g1_i1.p1  ORF type:complete len:421 (+),score=126.81 TRINITY_DN1470_c0_g1_i1:94-1263(+)
MEDSIESKVSSGQDVLGLERDLELRLELARERHANVAESLRVSELERSMLSWKRRLVEMEHKLETLEPRTAGVIRDLEGQRVGKQFADDRVGRRDDRVEDSPKSVVVAKERRHGSGTRTPKSATRVPTKPMEVMDMKDPSCGPAPSVSMSPPKDHIPRPRHEIHGDDSMGLSTSIPFLASPVPRRATGSSAQSVHDERKKTGENVEAFYEGVGTRETEEREGYDSKRRSPIHQHGSSGRTPRAQRGSGDRGMESAEQTSIKRPERRSDISPKTASHRMGEASPGSAHGSPYRMAPFERMESSPAVLVYGRRDRRRMTPDRMSVLRAERKAHGEKEGTLVREHPYDDGSPYRNRPFTEIRHVLGSSQSPANVAWMVELTSSRGKGKQMKF